METRRRFLHRLALGLGVAACRSSLAQPAENAAYVGVETSAATGLSRAAFFSASGMRVAATPLDFRAHGMVQQDATLVVFPRRPGTRFALVDLDTLEIRAVVSAPTDRHFYGHGAFTADGRHLLVTENDLHTLRGGIGVYEATSTMRRLGHIDLPGPGPHEIVRAPQGERFYIALGGLETHPDYGRTPLNLSAFRSQTLILDFASRRVEEMGYWSGTEGVSLRHLAVDGQGRLVIGAQTVDMRPSAAGRVLWLVEGGRVRSLDAGERLAGYVSSVAAHGDTTVATSKTSGTVLTFNGDRLIATSRLDGASAAAIGASVSASSGFSTLSLNDHRIEVSREHEFDNHGMALA